MIRSVFRLNPKTTLIFLFVALGPLGNILTPFFLPKSFRLYYLLLPFFPLFFLMAKERIAKIGIIFLPLLTYCFFSSYLVEKFDLANEEHTLFRFFLLLCQFFSVVGAASVLKEQQQVLKLLKAYLYSFFASLAVGYVFFFGYYLKVVPFNLIQQFSVLAQFGWGLLRFSPGSYPNEYGIVASFVLSILFLTYLEKRQNLFDLPKKWFNVFFLATFIAFLLTTTRAAYLSFFMSFIYITTKEKNFLKIAFRFALFIGACFLLLKPFGIHMFQILRGGFQEKINEGSLGERYEMWQEAIKRLEGNGFLGVGFASLTNAHNVYIQLLFELGFVGSVLLFGSLFFALIESFFKYKRPLQDKTFIFLQKIKMFGLINVLSFAASNHNLNHHLTWFVFFLCLVMLRLPYLEKLNGTQESSG